MKISRHFYSLSRVSCIRASIVEKKSTELFKSILLRSMDPAPQGNMCNMTMQKKYSSFLFSLDSLTYLFLKAHIVPVRDEKKTSFLPSFLVHVQCLIRKYYKEIKRRSFCVQGQRNMLFFSPSIVFLPSFGVHGKRRRR